MRSMSLILVLPLSLQTQRWNSALQVPRLMLSAGAGPFNVALPSQTLQSNLLFLAPSTVTHQSLL